jgi:hypothetical protein
MSTFRRRFGDTRYTDHAPHARFYRQCAANDDGEDDALRAARGIIGACVVGFALWSLMAVGVWAMALLWVE